jgi:hypothetical protein
LVGRRRRPEDRRIYRLRFAVVYLLLAVVAGSAIGAVVVLRDRAPENVGITWSAWSPEGDDFTFPRQIATFVGNRYRLQTGDPIVGVIASPAEVPTGDGSSVLPIRGAAVFNNPAGDDRDYTPIETDDSILYTLCGFGQGCSLQAGDPSEQQMVLLRREALELALYSFRYVDGLDTVITLMPTILGDTNTQEDDVAITLFFQRKDFKAELERPLSRTLADEPPAMGRITNAEELRVERLTAGRQYRFQFTPTGTNSLVMLLIPVQ